MPARERGMRRWLVFALLVCACAARATEIMEPNLAPSAMALGGAFVARADDASAAVLNPAGFAFQGKGSWMVGQLTTHRNNSAQVPGHGAPRNEAALRDLGFFYAGRYFPQADWGVSLGYAPLFHLLADWPGMGAGRAIVLADVLSASLIHAVSSRLALSVSLEGWRARAEIAHGGKLLQDKRWGWGWALGAIWRQSPEWRWGLLVRHAPRVALTGAGGERLALSFPDAVHLGLEWWNGKENRVEAELVWRRFSRFASLSLPGAPRPLALRDTLGARLGFAHAFRLGAEWRLGYAYVPAASRPSRFDPLVSDQPGHRLSVGIGGVALTVDWDLAFSYTIFPTRTNAGAYAGRYRDRAFAFAFSLGKAF